MVMNSHSAQLIHATLIITIAVFCARFLSSNKVNLLKMPHDQLYSVVVFTPISELKTKMPNNVEHLKETIIYIKLFSQCTSANKTKSNIVDLVQSIKLDQSRKTNKEYVKYWSAMNKVNTLLF